MRERPILFSAPMVRALLDGSKTQTRRAINPQPTITEGGGITWKNACYGVNTDGTPYTRVFIKHNCPYGQVGDQLWVRETFQDWSNMIHGSFLIYRADDPKDADGKQTEGPWKPSIFMPRKASRIQLEITNIRVERLNDISVDDCFAEGIKIPVNSDLKPLIRLTGKFPTSAYLPDFKNSKPGDIARAEYASLWESINGEGSWAKNEWVWVVEFKVAKP